MKLNITNVRNKVEEFLYPSTCIVCGEETKEELVCVKCRKQLVKIKQPKCMKCGKHIDNYAEEFCMDCRRIKHYYKTGIGAFEYNDYLKEAIYDFKYRGVSRLGELFGKEIAERYKYEILSWEADCLLPVPLHHKKLKKRGYNQSELMARAIGKRLNIPVTDDLLVRARNTKPQKELDDKERWKNLENAFLIRGNVVKLRKIIIVDDIYTTGATVDSCSRLLLEAGCEEVYYISLCIGVGI